MNIALCHEQLRSFREALSHLEQAMQVDPNNLQIQRKIRVIQTVID